MIGKVKKTVRQIQNNLRTKAALVSCVDAELIRQIKARRLTYLPEKKLVSVSNTCRELESKGLKGLFVEAGCALGGSAILISSIKAPERTFNIYDVFEMIPSPTEEDTADVHQRYKTIVEGKSTGLGGDLYYGYEENLLEKVKKNFADFQIDPDREGVQFIKGLLQETMTLDEEEVAFAHIDVDWYEPVKTCLERLFPRLVVGGSIILDDYYDWGGCKKAVDEFLPTIAGEVDIDSSAGSMKLTRLRPRQ